MLPVTWARRVRDVQVVFQHSTHRGWTARVCGDGFVLLDFPWHDNVDRLLEQEGTDGSSARLPTRAPAGLWWDTDQCWDATIQRVSWHCVNANAYDDAWESAHRSLARLIGSADPSEPDS